MTRNRLLLWTAGALGLALTAVPAFFVFSGQLSLQRHQWYMLIGMLLWFAVAPILIGRKREGEG